jgi:SnoaL-like protein
MSRPSIDELLDRAEIIDLLSRYCHQHDVLAPRFATGEADGTEFDVFDTIFTPDAIIDFTGSGGPRLNVNPMKEWMAKAYALFPVQQHVLGQTQFNFAADWNSATTLTWLLNPMGHGPAGGPLRVFVTGGYYRDRLVRTSGGWRIVERTFDPQWVVGDVPDLVLPGYEEVSA